MFTTELMFLVIAIMALLLILCFILCMVSFSKCSKLKSVLAEAEQTERDENFELNMLEKMTAFEKKINARLKNVPVIGGENNDMIFDSNALKNVGIVKFDAFSGITGNYSFSTAILNDNFDGIILTSIYGRESSNLYLREVKAGVAQTELLKEEAQALQKAMNQTG